MRSSGTGVCALLVTNVGRSKSKEFLAALIKLGLRSAPILRPGLRSAPGLRSGKGPGPIPASPPTALIESLLLRLTRVGDGVFLRSFPPCISDLVDLPLSVLDDVEEVRMRGCSMD